MAWISDRGQGPLRLYGLHGIGIGEEREVEGTAGMSNDGAGSGTMDRL